MQAAGRSRLRLPASARGRLAMAAGILMFGFVLSRLTGLARNVVISAEFGTGTDVAAYLAGLRLPDFIFQVVAGGAVASAFIPVFTTYLTRKQEDDGWRLVSSLFNLTLLILLPVCLILTVCAPQVVSLVAPGFNPELQELASSLARIMMISPLFFALGCFTSSVLNTFRRFFLAALAPTAYNLGIIGGALLLNDSIGVYGLAVGSTTGALLFFLIQIPGLRQVRMIYRPVVDLAHRGVREVGRLMAPRALGLAAAQVNFLVALVLASGMPEKYAALEYAWTIAMLPLGIFAMAISTAVFPNLAEQRALEQTAEMKKTVVATLRLIIFLTVPATVGLIVLRVPITALIFQRAAFTAQSTADTSYALGFYAIGLVALGATEITARAFYALHNTKTPVLAALLAMILNLGLSLALVGWLQQGGLALAMSLASIVAAIFLLRALSFRIGAILDRHMLLDFLKVLASSAVMGLAVYYFALWLETRVDLGRFGDQVLFVAAAITLGAALYLTAAIVLRCHDARRLLRLLPARH